MAFQDQILSVEFRKKVIDEMIEGEENLRRKNDALRKHEIFRDKNSKWVLASLENEEYNDRILAQMRNRVSNISICKKVIKKKARTYNGGVLRKVEDDKSQQSIDSLTKELDINSAMKKSDRYRELMAQGLIHPVPVLDTTQDKFTIKAKVFAPWEYDVIEDPNDLTKPAVVILTDFPERFRVGPENRNLEGGANGIRNRSGRKDLQQGNRQEEVIADSPTDAGTDDLTRTFIWWSQAWHFTTDRTGKIIDVPFAEGATIFEQAANPIQVLPFVNITQEQDCHFWAQGGDDISDTSILVNKILTDINFITYLQGWGQLVISGKDLPNAITGGPGKAFLFEVKEGDPTPQVFYASSNPPIQDWLNTAHSQLAMMLSTNNLSVRQIATKMDAASAASGIALLIENSELVGSQQDVQQVFKDKEPDMWEIIRLWHSSFAEKKALVPALQEIPVFTDSNVQLVFTEMNPPVTEKELLEVIKLRKELKLNTPVELLQKDNPNLSEKEAETKLEELNGPEEEEETPIPPTGEVVQPVMEPPPQPNDEE